jgi:hypothetical protein
MDVDSIEPGLDFIEIIERTVGSCDVLIALIGRQWLTSTDAAGQRRLDNPEDFVRQEIATALKRNIRVIPALLQNTRMPRTEELPEVLKPLTRRNALELNDAHFHRDVDGLIETLDRVLGMTRSPSSQAGPTRTATAEPLHDAPAAQSSSPGSKKFWGIVNVSLSFPVYGLAVLVGLQTGPSATGGLSGPVAFLSVGALVMLIVGIVQLVQHFTGSRRN